VTDAASSSGRDLVVDPAGFALWRGLRWRCALGRGGVRRDKSEGDGATPAGAWTMRRVLYRADRLARPETALPVSVIAKQDGWCDAPQDPNYNRPVPLPYKASAESLWREDGIYDLIVPLGYNDVAIVPGAGSAIFLHLPRPDFSPTEGCVALAMADLLGLLREADSTSRVIVEAA
jgi:L,D-peptidoglycan transpeptidase YkuD (ErfK/YbiS/YcfS/YnhG family)